MDRSGFFDEIEEKSDLEMSLFSNKSSREVNLESLLCNIVPHKIEEGYIHIMSSIPTTDNFLSLFINAESLPVISADSPDLLCYDVPIIIFGLENCLKLAYCKASPQHPVSVSVPHLAFKYIGESQGVSINYFLYYVSLQLSLQNSSTFKSTKISDTSLLHDFRFQLRQMACKIPTLSEQEQLLDGVFKMLHEDNRYLHKGNILNKGKYFIDKVIGNGGFANTYIAHTLEGSDKKTVCIKELFVQKYCFRDIKTENILPICSQDAAFYFKCAIHKFVGEIDKIKLCKSPYIIKVHDSFKEHKTYYYVMDYLPGGTLAERMQKEGHFNEEEAIKCIKKVALALKEMHSHNMLHLDIKPSNILMHNNDPVLIDFGATKLYDNWGTQCSHNPLVISSENTPPEFNFKNSLEKFLPQTDIYQLGTTLQTLLVGSSDVYRFQRKYFSSEIYKLLRRCFLQVNHRIKDVDTFIKELEFAENKKKTSI